MANRGPVVGTGASATWSSPPLLLVVAAEIVATNCVDAEVQADQFAHRTTAPATFRPVRSLRRAMRVAKRQL